MSFDQDRSGYESNLPRPVDTSLGNGMRGPSTGGSGPDDDIAQRLHAALHAPFGIDKLLNRLKQSVYSARDFSSFLKERSALEDRHAQGYKKLVRHASESIRKPEARQGSYARNFEESLRLNDRLAENGLQLASALHTMAEELRDMADNSEKGRKHWKHTAMDAEKKVADAENAQQKAKDRYNTAAEQYERVRTGEKQGGKFGLKNKSPAQQEEALKEKADMLDQDYTARTRVAQEERRDFENTTRPQVVRALRDLITECDAAMAMQMAKLASVSEKHVVSNGMAIAPITTGDSSGLGPRGLRQIASGIDDRKDFSDYMLDGVEPPAQFKGRSRRNTDAELVHNPMQSSQNLDRTNTFDSSYNGNQAHVESAPPQLPQIGHDTFSSSFDAPKPGMQERDSFGLGQPETLQGPASNQSQQTGVTQEPVSSIGAGRGAPTLPPLPSYDRAQASQSGFGDPPSFDRSQGPVGHDTVHPARQDAMISATELPSYRAPPQQAGGYNGRPSLDQGNGPIRQDTVPPTRQDAMISATGLPSYRTPGMQAGAYDGRPSLDHGQGHLRQDSIGPARQDSLPPAAGRGQSPMSGGQGPYLGRGGPAPGSYMDPGKDSSPYGMTGSGRGQPPASRNLPSQQQARPTLPPNMPVFGVHLDDLFRRDGSAVPAIVFQCIQAVDTFGLNTEGIYRTSGAAPTVMQLKSEFDHGKFALGSYTFVTNLCPDSSKVDLKDAESFNHDIASVATLLKNFLRDLPDPLLTGTAYHSFIQAAKFEDNIMRRDGLHQSINGLPDPNYATLRVLTLHLHRVAMNSDINKMDMRNLAIVFGPTVMGGSNIADAPLQQKVMETILHHTHDIFDPDD